MITATGGKWTTTTMAEHAVDAVIAVGGEEMKSRASACRTDDVAVVGAHGFRRDLPAVLLSGAASARGTRIDKGAGGALSERPLRTRRSSTKRRRHTSRERTAIARRR